MPQQLPEKFVMKRKPMGESDIILKNQNGSNGSLDISEFVYSNNELVSFENAAVNIDNSNDVILGPVTQLNVNGNVTIVQNGLQDDLVNEKAGFDTAKNIDNGKISKIFDFCASQIAWEGRLQISVLFQPCLSCCIIRHYILNRGWSMEYYYQTCLESLIIIRSRLWSLLRGNP